MTADDLDPTETGASSEAAADPAGPPSEERERRRGNRRRGDRREASQGGYGNIYTPHAGSMIIQVQRESGLQSRTFVLSPRQVRVLRVCTSRTGKTIAGVVAAVLLLLVVQAARVPSLTFRISRMQHTAERLDTLEHSLTQLQRRYDQVRTMMGVDSSGMVQTATANVPGFTPASSVPRSTPMGIASATDADAGSATSDSGGALGDAAVTIPVRVRPHRKRAPAAAAAPTPTPAESTPTVVEPPPPDSGAPPNPQADQQ